LTITPIRRNPRDKATEKGELHGESPLRRRLRGSRLYFLRGYLPRPTMFDVMASLLWPLSLALTLAWLMTIDDDALSL
jgi:hypothetical protein